MKTIAPLLAALSIALASLHGIAHANLETGSAAFVRKDYGTAFAALLPIAQQGNAQAQRMVGTMYLHGNGVARSEVDAAQWFRLSAEQGDTAAMENLGRIYVQGRGVSQDIRQATQWFRKAKAGALYRTADIEWDKLSGPTLTSSQEFVAACKQVPPQMPRLAAQNSIIGTVRAAVFMDEGVAKDAVIYSGPRVFHDAVRQALLQYDCSPQKVHVMGTQEFVFVVDDGAAPKPIYTVVQREPVFASEPPPFNSNWAGLSNAQKMAVRGQYTNLQADDEPPYPTEGMGELVEGIRLMAEYLGVQGNLRLDVKIAANGKVDMVNVLETPDAAFSKHAASVVYGTAYKPAMCGAQACAMSLPVDITITRGPTDKKQAAPDEVSILHDAAGKGDPRAQNDLGERYMSARGVFLDAAQAVQWFRRSAEQGYRRAQLNLARAYAGGRGIGKDPALALGWFRKAAEQGDPQAQFVLGTRYMYGNGVAKDMEQAIMWYRKSADQGYSYAQNNLADAYENGHGTAVDLAQALKWYGLAAAQSDEVAHYSLSRMHAEGRGVPADQATAMRLLKTSADLGYAKAQFELAQMYADGNGMDKDTDMAVQWYRKAARGKFQKAIDKLKELGLAM